MSLCSKCLILGGILLTALCLCPTPHLLAQAVASVTVTPTVVPVPTSASQHTAVLVTATVSGLAAGTTASCVGKLSQEPSGTAILTSPTVSTSPASASGSTSVSMQFLVPGGTPAGPAQASVSCNGSTAVAAFRISSFVGVAVSPTTVPAGGVAAVTTMIAGGAALGATPCTLTLTDPSGSAPPLLSQSMSVSGGTITTPASTAVSLTLPNAAPLGTANVAVSCVVAGSPAGDSSDFTITDPTVVTILGFTTPAVVGSPLSVTSVTLPGFSCVTLFTPPTGLRISSPPALADATGTVVNVVPLGAGLQVGTGSLSVTCSDPNNPGNSATSAAQVLALVSAAALSVSATLTNTTPPLVGGSLVSIAVSTSPGASCSLGGLTASGIRFPISDASASGTVPASGLLTLSFHLPATIPAGTAVVIASCSNAGLSASAQVTAPVGAAQGAQNCDGATAPTGTPSAPVASAGGSYAGSSGEPVQFEGAGSAPSTNAVFTSCVWTFGDGGRATTLNPTHVYAAPGNYTATLQVTDSAGLSARATAAVSISGFVPQCSPPSALGGDAPVPCPTGPSCPALSLPGGCLPPCATPIAPAALCPQPGITATVITGGPYGGSVSQSISFHASTDVTATRRVCAPDTSLGTGGPICSVVPDDSVPAPVGYLWDFGDGTQASDDTTAHAYGQAGTYTITVTAYLDDGSRVTGTTTATITALPGSS
jgi:PKD repeat protein